MHRYIEGTRSKEKKALVIQSCAEAADKEGAEVCLSSHVVDRYLERVCFNRDFLPSFIVLG